MAFNDLPIIDIYSKNADQSEVKFREVFNQHNNFIPRADVPDKGCDFDIELIISNNQSSNWRFPTQLKSLTNLTLVDNHQFISYPFETSRLGYLIRRLPCMGLVVLYSVKENKCYYDYCDQIYERIKSERETEEWKENDKVNIKIPYLNVIDNVSSKEIHKVFCNRFEQATIMQNSYGIKYGLPTFSLINENKFDFNNTDDVKRFLSEYGILLLNNYDFTTVFGMINQIPHPTITNNKDLLLLATVTYTETGLYSDSDFFCNKLSKYKLDANEVLLIEFTKLKNKFFLGYIEEDQFIQKLKAIETLAFDEEGKLSIEINLIKYELLDSNHFNNATNGILDKINKVFESIKGLPRSDRIKHIMLLWNCDNLSYLINRIEADNLTELRLRESLKTPMSLSERKDAAYKVISIQKTLEIILEEISDKAFEKNDSLLKAYCFSFKVRSFILRQINHVLFEDLQNLEGFESTLASMIYYAIHAFNYFLEINLYKDAYDSICNAIEIEELGGFLYPSKEKGSKISLYEKKEFLESKFDLKSRDIIILNTIRDSQKRAVKEKEGGSSFVKDLSDDNIDFIGRILLKAHNIPSENLENIKAEFKAYRLFYQRCNDKTLIVLQVKDEAEINEIKYSSPTRFVLRSKITGLETAPSIDMNLLLSSLGF